MPTPDDDLSRDIAAGRRCDLASERVGDNEQALTGP